MSIDVIRPAAPRRLNRGAAAVAASAALTAIAVAIATQTRKTARIDRAVRDKIHPRRSPRVVRLAKAVSFPAAPTSHPVVAIAASCAISRIEHRVAPATIVASLLALGLDRAVRLAGDQRRPPMASKRSGRERFGFPSGHTGAATAVAFAAAIDWSKGRSRSEKIRAYAIAGVCSAAVGWSRLELDEHWIDDVVGGWAIGVGAAILAVASCE